MSQTKKQKLENLYIELKKLIENQNYTKIIKTSNKILSEDDHEVKAWQCKLIAQIQMGDFNGGLKSLKNCKIIKELLFEKAYCEYRLNLVEEAWNTLSNAPNDSPVRVKELQSQILYRLERYEECFVKYRELIKTSSDHYDQERLANVAAVCANCIQAGVMERGPKFGADASYEQLYNSACELLFMGQVEEALALLNNSEAICIKSLTQDGVSLEEINDEVAIIRIQQGHCLQLLGREKEAFAVYDAVLKNKPDDPALLAILNNNVVANNRDANIFDSKKRMKIATSPGLLHKLTTKQLDTIAVNHCLLIYMTNKEDDSIDALKVSEKYPSLLATTTILRAAQFKRTGKAEESIKLLTSFAAQWPEYGLVGVLSAAQILLEKKRFEETIQILSSLEDKHKYCSGVVSSLLILLCNLGKADEACSMLSEAVAWHSNIKGSAAEKRSFLQRAARFYLRNGRYEAAADIFETLRKLDPSNRRILARLISAYSQFNAEVAQRLSADLPDVSVDDGIDTESLEASFGSKYARKPKTTAATTPDSRSSNSAATKSVRAKLKRKSKKKKKIRLPKNCVPGQEVDPERWLPRWQRKGYKKKRDRRNKLDKDVMKGTQGVSSEAADKYDITKTSHTQKNSRPSVASPQADSGSKWMQKRKGRNRKH